MAYDGTDLRVLDEIVELLQEGGVDPSDRETDEQIKARIAQEFRDVWANVGQLAYQAGTIKAIVIFGDAGAGKSYAVNSALKWIEQNGGGGYRGNYKITGRITPPQLYRILYENDDKVIVFDDADSIMRDENALNLIKAATDPDDGHAVSWASNQPVYRDETEESVEIKRDIATAKGEAKSLGTAYSAQARAVNKLPQGSEREEAEEELGRIKAQWDEALRNVVDLEEQLEQSLILPKTFEFHGGIIVITNIDFQAEADKGGRFAPHYEAILDRAKYIAIRITTPRQMLVRLRMIIDPKGIIAGWAQNRTAGRNDKSGGMLDRYDLNPMEQVSLLEFIEEHYEDIDNLGAREVIRMTDAIKRARAAVASGIGTFDDWKDEWL